MTLPVLLLLLLLGWVGVPAAAAPTAPLLPISLSARPNQHGVLPFLDSAGRERFFHGTNAVVKGPPYIPLRDHFDADVSLSDRDFEIMKEHGFTVLRLGLMWAGVNPERGVVNATYLEVAQDIVAAAARAGIYTLLDMHQDVLSEAFCGEGVPAWVAASTHEPPGLLFPAPIGGLRFSNVSRDPATGFPSRQVCAGLSWAELYFSCAACHAFERLYTNQDGLLDEWAAFWHAAAKAFKGNPAVLGVELINEPWAGDVCAHPTLMLPSRADGLRLQPAYDKLSEAVRAADPARLVFFAAVTFDDFVPVGFSHPPGGPIHNRTSVFAYHYYKPPQITKINTYMKIRVADARRLGTGAMLTEVSGGDTFPDVADAADTMGQSWAFWELKTFCKESNSTLSSPSQFGEYGACKTGYGGGLINPDGSVNKAAMKPFARTYPLAVAGACHGFSFNTTTGQFSMEFEPNPDATGPTEVFASQVYYYPRWPPHVTVAPASALAVSFGPDRVVFQTNGLAAGVLIRVTISPMQ